MDSWTRGQMDMENQRMEELNQTFHQGGSQSHTGEGLQVAVCQIWLESKQKRSRNKATAIEAGWPSTDELCQSRSGGLAARSWQSRKLLQSLKKKKKATVAKIRPLGRDSDLVRSLTKMHSHIWRLKSRQRLCSAGWKPWRETFVAWKVLVTVSSLRWKAVRSRETP